MMRSPGRSCSPAASRRAATASTILSKPSGFTAVLFLAVHEDPARSGVGGLDTGPERNGAVKDVAGKDLLDLQIEIRRVRELESGE